MQVVVIEYARHCAGLKQATSIESEPDARHPVVTPLVREHTHQSPADSRPTPLGGTMRLGAHTCHLQPGSLVARTYGQNTVRERYRHRYEVNADYVTRLQQAGLVVSGWTQNQRRTEVVELPSHPWFLACQFHPEFQSHRGADIPCSPVISAQPLPIRPALPTPRRPSHNATVWL